MADNDRPLQTKRTHFAELRVSQQPDYPGRLRADGDSIEVTIDCKGGISLVKRIRSQGTFIDQLLTAYKWSLANVV
jgi:hypothetical protein